MPDDCCIDCGECIKVCNRQAVRPLTGSLAELSKFDYTVAVPSLALFTQFDPRKPPASCRSAPPLRLHDAVGLSATCMTVSRTIESSPSIGASAGHLVVLPDGGPPHSGKYPTLLDQLLPSCRRRVWRDVKRRKSSRQGCRERIRVVYIALSAKMVGSSTTRVSTGRTSTRSCRSATCAGRSRSAEDMLSVGARQRGPDSR
jgi:hypothetical protein